MLQIAPKVFATLDLSTNVGKLRGSSVEGTNIFHITDIEKSHFTDTRENRFLQYLSSANTI